MKTLLKNAKVFENKGKGQYVKKDLLIDSDKLAADFDNEQSNCLYDRVFDFKNKYIIPGFVDVHVHLREPGFFYKESIRTGTLAGAHGGYTTVCTMPNLNPPPNNLKNLEAQLEIIDRDAVINVIPYATITMSGNGRSELADMASTAPYVIGFSDDGRGVQTGDLMEEAMLVAKSLSKPIVAHCEDESLLEGGYIHKGEYAKKNSHQGISSESEWVQVARDVELAAKTGCKYHVCHISTKETVDIIRQAKKSGVDVSCETAPHYLILTDMDLKEEGRFKMNPPIRSMEDKEALIEGIKDGTIDMIATDHAPHSSKEKSRGLEKSAFGIVGLETSFALLNTYLVQKGIITPEELVKLMSINPRERFNLPGPRTLSEGTEICDITVLDPNKIWTIDSAKFMSKGRATPFDGVEVVGKVSATFVSGILKFLEV